MLTELLTDLIGLSALFWPAEAVTLTLLTNFDLGEAANPGNNTIAMQADAIQRYFDEGPGLTAEHTRSVSIAPDLALELRWPKWTPEALKLGIRSVMSVPLISASPAGSLNLYGLSPRMQQQFDIDRLHVLAELMGGILAAQRNVENLQRAIETRTVIGQAQGILIERHGVTAQAAFQLLRRHSQHQNTKLNALATRLVTEGRLPDLDTEM